MVIIPPVAQYSSNYQIIPINGFTYHLHLTIENGQQVNKQREETQQKGYSNSVDTGIRVYLPMDDFYSLLILYHALIQYQP